MLQSQKEKLCSGCGQNKDQSQFYRGKTGRLSWRCKSCTCASNKVYQAQEHVRSRKSYANQSVATKLVLAANQREYNRAHRESLKSNKQRRNYNVPLDWYDATLALQGGGCAVCGKTPEEEGRALALDHDHRCCPDRRKSCGKCVRGLLCTHCNHGIGKFRDDADLLRRAADYVNSSVYGSS